MKNVIKSCKLLKWDVLASHTTLDKILVALNSVLFLLIWAKKNVLWTISK